MNGYGVNVAKKRSIACTSENTSENKNGSQFPPVVVGTGHRESLATDFKTGLMPGIGQTSDKATILKQPLESYTKSSSTFRVAKNTEDNTERVLRLLSAVNTKAVLYLTNVKI